MNRAFQEDTTVRAVPATGGTWFLHFFAPWFLSVGIRNLAGLFLITKPTIQVVFFLLGEVHFSFGIFRQL